MSLSDSALGRVGSARRRALIAEAIKQKAALDAMAG